MNAVKHKNVRAIGLRWVRLILTWNNTQCFPHYQDFWWRQTQSKDWMNGWAQLTDCQDGHHQACCLVELLLNLLNINDNSWATVLKMNGFWIAPNYLSLHISSEHSLQCLTQHHMHNIGQWEHSSWVGEPAQFSPDHYVHLSWNRHNKIFDT